MILNTMDEVAAILRISRRTLQDLIKIHPYYKVVGKRRKLFSLTDIEKICDAVQFPLNSLSATAQAADAFPGLSEASRRKHTNRKR
jgi:hypothetical protein